MRPDCRCGHPHEMHTHLRDGTDCGKCGRQVCPTYRRPPVPFRELMTRLVRRLR